MIKLHLRMVPDFVKKMCKVTLRTGEIFHNFTNDLRKFKEGILNHSNFQPSIIQVFFWFLPITKSF